LHPCSETVRTIPKVDISVLGQLMKRHIGIYISAETRGIELVLRCSDNNTVYKHQLCISKILDVQVGQLVIQRNII